MWTSFAFAALLLTRLPPLTMEPPTREGARRAVALFPLVSALLGLLLGAVWTLANHLWSAPQSLVPAALTLAASAIITGGRPVGGIARAADALAALDSHGDRVMAFAVMSDTRRGTAGTVAAAVAAVVKLALLASLPAVIAWPALILSSALGGWGQAFAVSAFPAASASGSAGESHGLSDAGPTEFILATILALVCAAVLPTRGLLTLLVVAVIIGPTAQAIRRVLGGFNTPLAAALGELAELVALAALTLH